MKNGKENKMKTITKKTIEEVLETFKVDQRVFSNEAQFQFELGRALEKAGHTVFFEVLSIDDNEKDAKRRKIYIDIVVDLGGNEYVAIELKYKSPGSRRIQGAIMKRSVRFVIPTKTA